MRYVTWVILIAALSLGVYFVLILEDQSDLDETSKIKNEQPVYLKDPDLFEFQNNRVKLQITSDKAWIYENQKLSLLENIKGKIYSIDPKKKPTLIKADKGKIEGNSKLMTIWGNVRIDFSEGQKLFTERLYFDQKREIIYNNVAVLVLSDQDEVNGSSMHYDLKIDLLKLTEPEAKIELNI